MISIEVRAVDSGDLHAIEGLLATARDEVTSQRGGREAALRELTGAEVLLLAFHATGEAETLLGFLALGRVEDTAIIDAIYVAPPCREIGVGAALLGRALKWARDAGCARIDAVALPGDRATKNFFETHGLTARAIIVQREL